MEKKLKFIAFGVITLASALTIVQFVSNEKEKKDKRDQVENKLIREEIILESNIESFKKSGKDTTKEFRAYFSDCQALSPDEKEDFVENKKIPKRIVKEFEKLKNETIESYCRMNEGI